MLFIVPDDADETLAEGSPKAQLDDGEPVSSGAARKVELDLDDAPFLEEEEEEEHAPLDVGDSPALEPTDSKPRSAWWKNKFFILGLVIAILLLAVLIKQFLFPTVIEVPAPALPPEIPAAPSPTPEPETPKEEKPAETVLRLEPFWIEQHDEKGDVRFLVVRLACSTDNPLLARDFQRETILVRNAIYYYLRNKDLQYLSDKKNADALKKELLTVINQYMSAGQFETLLFEQYLVK